MRNVNIMSFSILFLKNDFRRCLDTEIKKTKNKNIEFLHHI